MAAELIEWLILYGIISSTSILRLLVFKSILSQFEIFNIRLYAPSTRRQSGTAAAYCRLYSEGPIYSNTAWPGLLLGKLKIVTTPEASQINQSYVQYIHTHTPSESIFVPEVIKCGILRQRFRKHNISYVSYIYGKVKNYSGSLYRRH